MEHVTILGDGAWGTACASLLAHNKIPVTLWCYNEDVAQHIAHHQENTTFLPGIKLDTTYIHPTTSHREAIEDASYVYFAIPVRYLRNVLENCHPYMQSDQMWISLSKGIEQDTGLLPTHIVTDVASERLHTGVIAGPSFARELANHKPTGFVCATHERAQAQTCINAFSSDYTTLSYHDDVIGTQVGGALKNIYAIASGIIDARINAYNTAALLTTRAFGEMEKISQAYGGRADTIATLAGLGDLMLTCQSSQSRNQTVGQKIGSDINIQDYLEQVDCVPEGINTIAAMMQVCRERNISAPLIQTMYDIVYNKASSDQLVATLLSQ